MTWSSRIASHHLAHICIISWRPSPSSLVSSRVSSRRVSSRIFSISRVAFYVCVISLFSYGTRLASSPVSRHLAFQFGVISSTLPSRELHSLQDDLPLLLHINRWLNEFSIIAWSNLEEPTPLLSRVYLSPRQPYQAHHHVPLSPAAI